MKKTEEEKYLCELKDYLNMIGTKQNDGELIKSSVIPRFCFVCGTALEEMGMGFLNCKNKKCGAVFLPFKNEYGNQSLELQNVHDIK